MIFNQIKCGFKVIGFGLTEALPYIGVSILNIIAALSTLFIGFLIVRVSSDPLKSWMSKSGLSKILVEFTTRLIKIFLYILVVLIALTFLGLEMGATLISISVVFGFVLGFALSDSLSNIAAGFMIAITKPFKKGDRVTINGEMGTIKGVGISVTSVDTPDNKRIVVPNKLIWGSNIINFTRHSIRRVDIEAGVGYDDNLDKVIRVTMKLLERDERVLSDPKPRVAVKEMADSAIILVIRPWVKQEDYWDFYYDFQKALKQKYDEEGISIPYPQMDVHLDK